MLPELHTQRYLLQQIKPEDQAFIYQGLSDPQVIPYYGVHFTSFEATAAQMEFYERLWRERSGCWWKIVDKQTGIRVGACGMNAYQPQHEKAEIGYWLLPDFWKKGIMPEVLPVMIRYVLITGNFTDWRQWSNRVMMPAANFAKNLDSGWKVFIGNRKLKAERGSTS